MLGKEDRVIAGISGGADSICLLFVLLELKKELGFDLVAVHVHHGLRGASADREGPYRRRGRPGGPQGSISGMRGPAGRHQDRFGAPSQ